MAEQGEVFLDDLQRPEFRGRFHIAGADSAQKRRRQDPAGCGPLMDGVGDKRRRKPLTG